MLEALRWFVRSFGPYVVGILVGVFFAYLLTLFVSGTKVPTSYEQWLALVEETSQTLNGEPPAAAPAPAAKEKEKAKPIPSVPPAAKPEAAPQAAKPEAAPPAKPPVAEKAPLAAPVADKKPQDKPPATAQAAPAPVVSPPEAVKPAEAAVEKKEPAARETSSTDNVLSCGAPPRQPGNEMNQYLACRWKENCLNRLAQARYMIEQGKLRCPTTGYNAQACQAYYQSLEDRYQPSMCEH